MGDAYDLPAARDLFELHGDFLRRSAAESRVYLIEYHSIESVSAGDNALYREHYARQLAARSDFCEGFERLARVCGDEKFYIVRTVYCKRRFFSVDFEADRRHIEEFELFGHSALKLARRLFARCGKLFGEGANLGFGRADERIELFDPLIRKGYFIALLARGIKEREHFIFRRAVFY